jgi:starch synthase
MRVLYVTAELYPLVKTGGLADVSAALPAALRDLDIEVGIILPGYPQALGSVDRASTVAKLDGLMGHERVRLVEARTPDSGILTWLVDCPDLFAREGGIYQDQAGRDWHDNAARFALFNHVAAVVGMAWRADVIHGQDWHAALLPLIIARREQPRPATVLTIHNLAFQGVFGFDNFCSLGLPDTPAVTSSLEFYGRMCFLKAGIAHADMLTTVSPTYASEILTPEFGCGLDGMLRTRCDRLVGIMNGANYTVWDPSSDPHLPARFAPGDFAGKEACKSALRQEMGLATDTGAPVFAFNSRLAHQKMPDTVLQSLPAFLDQGIQFALVAEGENEYETRFRALAAAHPGQVAIHIGHREPLAHRLIAGADILLHPSRYEPCGLVPIYAMRYGTLPIVRKTGGTADSVVDAQQHSVDNDTATGFIFEQPTVEHLAECTHRALTLSQRLDVWRRVQMRAMRQDFGWERSARAYAEIYRGLVKPPVEPEISEKECTDALAA